MVLPAKPELSAGLMAALLQPPVKKACCYDEDITLADSKDELVTLLPDNSNCIHSNDLEAVAIMFYTACQFKSQSTVMINMIAAMMTFIMINMMSMMMMNMTTSMMIGLWTKRAFYAFQSGLIASVHAILGAAQKKKKKGDEEESVWRQV